MVRALFDVDVLLDVIEERQPQGRRASLLPRIRPRQPIPPEKHPETMRAPHT